MTSPILHFASNEAVAHAKAGGMPPESIVKKFVAVQMATRHFETHEA